MAKWFVFFILVTNCAVAQTKWTIADAENFQKNLNEEYLDPDESPLNQVIRLFPYQRKFCGNRSIYKIRKRTGF